MSKTRTGIIWLIRADLQLLLYIALTAESNTVNKTIESTSAWSSCWALPGTNVSYRYGCM